MAASFLGKLLVKIEGDNSDLDKSIKTSEGSVKKFSKLAVGAYALVGVAILAVGKKFSKLAAQAEEIRSKFNVVFGRTAREVKDWAQTYSESVGRSTTDTLQFLGSIGDLLKPLGFAKDDVDDLSKQVVTLANDLGSFNDMPTADVMRDIQSALVGNFEVTKKYGVVLNETIIKQAAFNRGLFDGKGVVDAQVKAQVALELIMLGTADAQGDLLRTQESATNVTIRLESATKDLGIALGDQINQGLTPMKSVLADIVSELADWIDKQNEARSILRDLTDGTLDESKSLETLLETQKRLNAEIASGRFSASAVKQRKDALKILEDEINLQKRIAAFAREEAGFTDARKDQIADRRRLEALAIQQEQERLDDLKALATAFDKTDEAERRALETQIAYFESFQQTGRVLFVLAELREKLNNLNKEDDETVLKLHEDYTVMFGTVRGGFIEGTSLVDDQIQAINDLKIDIEALANEGLGAFASAFQMVGQEGVSAFDVIKQAGKDAASAVLQGLGKQALARAALAFAIPFGAGIPTAIKYGAAASLAFAASGFIQNLAEGGVIAPATGGVPAVMAEAGVPEMAMPLTSSAINPFADAVANRISTTTNNNTQNFNSMFSLNDDNRMRETARRLFPFNEEEKHRRGIV